MRRLIDPEYMAFPLRIGKGGAATSRRKDHVRQQIEQVLFTNPGERVYRSQFGAGLQQRVFEPNTTALEQGVRQSLVSALVDVLQGEVDPKTFSVTTESRDEVLTITVSYQLATIGQWENYEFNYPQGGGGG